MLDKGTKLVPVWEVLGDSDTIDDASVAGQAVVSHWRGKLIKAHIGPAGSNGVLGGGDGRLVTLVVRWNGHHASDNWGRWQMPTIGVYVGRCNGVLGGGDGGEESTWDVLELVRYEGSGRVADSVGHIGQLVAQSLVGAV